MTERERRLPKWAQDELIRLRRQLRAAREAIEKEGPADSNTFAGDYGTTLDMTPRRALGRDERISFYMSDDADDWHNRMDVRITRDGGVPWLTVMGSDAIAVRPASSNVVRIRPMR